MANHTPSFPDHNQNFWQLACIISASQGIPGFFIGGILAKKYGALTALTSICVGNLLLWLIGLGIISMAVVGRRNLVQVARDYLGKWGGVAVALILMTALIFWYALELKGAVKTLQPFFPSNWDGMKVGFIAGMLIAIMGIGGIRLIKCICVWSFPVLLFIIVWEIFCCKNAVEWGHWGIAFDGLVMVGMLNLSGFVNLSTFFRHSRSRADSILALSLAGIFNALFQIPSIVMKISSSQDFFVLGSNVLLFFVFVVAVGSLIRVNLDNIYCAAAGVEEIFPFLRKPWHYFCIGLVGSVIFACCFRKQYLFDGFFEGFTNNCIVELGVILLMAFFAKTVIGKKLEFGNKAINFGCWIFGCLVALVVELQDGQNTRLAFIFGLWASMLSFLIVFFIQRFVVVVNKLKKSVSI